MRRFRKRLWLLAGAVVAVVGVLVAAVLLTAEPTVGYDPVPPPPTFDEFPLTVEVVPDTRPAFTFDPAQAWQIDLGRGSGMDGLETVEMANDGKVTLHRAKAVRQGDGYAHTWEKATPSLSPDAVKRIADAVVAERLPELGRAYHAGVFDGTQWVLWVRQGGREKVVYCDNHFPESVVRFAATVDAELVAIGAAVRWQQVPFWDERRHERELWDSLQR